MLDELFIERLDSPYFHFQFKGTLGCEALTGMPEILVMPTYTVHGCEEATQSPPSMADLKSR
jgi:hypothetical protein